MEKKRRRGFTIVELVIVVAVIGILAAILIPTFSNLRDKANVVADSALVTNINTQLAESESLDGKNKTMYDALLDAELAGYKVANINARSQNELVWDEDIDRFVLLDSNGTPIAGQTENANNKVKLWKIYYSLPSSQTYSIYAADGFAQKTVNITVGFDAGNNQMEAISYERTASNLSAQTVTIRSNGEGTVLTVNAPKDTIHHYDYLDELTVTAVANASYHEHGTVRDKASISQGHIVVENGSSVAQVVVESATGSVKVTANESTLVNVDTASASQTAIVANSRDVFVDGVDSSAISGSQASSVVLPTEIDTEAKLKLLLVNGGLAKLTEDIALTQSNYSYVRSELAGGDTELAALGTNKNVVLNLNGHDITGEALEDDINFIAIDNNGSMRVYDDSNDRGKIIANAKMFYVRGNLEILGGEFVSTVLTAGTDFRSMIIVDENASVLIHYGKFYTPKCVMTSWGNVTIDDGEFVCASASTGWTNAKGQSSFAYTVRLMDGVNYVNGGNFYGIHGALSCEGGRTTIANVYSEASQETLEKFGTYVEANNIKIHVLDNRAGEFLVDSAFVAAEKTSFKSSVHYGLYVCGEYNVVYVDVNSGTFKSSDKYGALIGNNNDGGKGLYAHTTINDGTFIGATGKVAVSETGIKITYGAGYTEIFGGVFSTNVTSLMKDTVNYQCIEQLDGTWKVVKR